MWDKNLTRQMELRQIKDIPIQEYLAGLAILPTKQHGRILWYSSPLRTEDTPSLAVYTDKNDWYDFGGAKGGSIIDLVMALNELPYIDAIRKLRDYLYT